MEIRNFNKEIIFQTDKENIKDTVDLPKSCEKFCLQTLFAGFFLCLQNRNCLILHILDA